MNRLISLVCSGVLLFAASASAATTEKRLAVLEFRGGIPVDALMVLADSARAGALSALEGKRYLVMTRESMATILKDMGMGECSEGECEVETARNIGADLVVTGEVTSIDGRYVVTLKLHETLKGALLATGQVDGANQFGLLSDVRAAVATLVRDGLNPTGPRAPALAIERGSMRVTSARVQAIYDAEKISVCVDPNDARLYGFCTTKELITENEFIRRHGKETGSRELDRFLLDHQLRESTGKYGWLAAGVGSFVLFGGTLAFSLIADSNAVGWISILTGTIAVAFGIPAIVVALDEDAEHISGAIDAPPEYHQIKEPDARRYVDQYNRALLDRMNREWGGNAGFLEPVPRERLFEPSARLVVGPTGIGLVGTF